MIKDVIVLLAGAFALLPPGAFASVIRIDNPAPTAAAAFGTGVAGIGDVNADGTPDLVIGAPGADKAYVLSGIDRAVIRTLSDPDGLSKLQFGFSVAGAGDVTGDGVEDVAVGAPGQFGLIPLPCLQNCPPPEWGRVFLFNGANGALIRKLLPTPATKDFLVFGFSLARLGDVNGDGVSDLAVGSPVLRSFWGEVYAFSGKDGSQLWVTREPGDRQPIASFGEFLARVGDVNGDGRPDLVAAAPFHDTDPAPATSVLAGKVFLLSGANGAVLRTHQSAAPVESGFFGAKVSGIGDQDPDGAEDYLIGERGAGVIQLRSGATGNLTRSITSPANETPGGWLSLARAGDRDGDGKEDFWLGAPVTGAVYLLNGTGSTLLQVSDPGSPVPGVLTGLGSFIASTGDLDGDGKPEILVAKPGEKVGGQNGAGAVYLMTSNRPPHADAGPDQVVSAGSDCLGMVTLNGTASTDPDGDSLSYAWAGPFGLASGASPMVSLPLGTHSITLTVDDGHGGTDSDTVEVTVADTTGPDIHAIAANPHTLWPPNHRMVPVRVSLSASDNCDAAPTCRIVDVTSNEPVNGPGDGNNAPDWEITGALTLDLRAERSGQGTGRAYTITVECVDFSGNRKAAIITVRVPHDRGTP